MMMPSIFGKGFFDDDWMSFPFRSEVFQTKPAMRTDVKELDNGFELSVDLPGYNKEDIKASLENGYLTVSASRQSQNDEKDENGKYIRRERYQGSVSRSFFVGEGLAKEDVNASYENGILKLFVPKKEQKQVEENKYIAIS